MRYRSIMSDFDGDRTVPTEAAKQEWRDLNEASPSGSMIARAEAPDLTLSYAIKDEGMVDHHNHTTRDIKKPGICPACDRYWEKVEHIERRPANFFAEAAWEAWRPYGSVSNAQYEPHIKAAFLAGWEANESGRND